jgi:hypothetical protein
MLRWLVGTSHQQQAHDAVVVLHYGGVWQRRKDQPLQLAAWVTLRAVVLQGLSLAPRLPAALLLLAYLQMLVLA